MYGQVPGSSLGCVSEWICNRSLSLSLYLSLSCSVVCTGTRCKHRSCFWIKKNFQSYYLTFFSYFLSFSSLFSFIVSLSLFSVTLNINTFFFFCAKTIYKYYIYILHRYNLATLGLPYECTKCKQRNRILVICAHCPRKPWELLKHYWLSIEAMHGQCAQIIKIRFLCLHLVQSYGRLWKKGDWVHASSMYIFIYI